MCQSSSELEQITGRDRCYWGRRQWCGGERRLWKAPWARSFTHALKAQGGLIHGSVQTPSIRQLRRPGLNRSSSTPPPRLRFGAREENTLLFLCPSSKHSRCSWNYTPDWKKMKSKIVDVLHINRTCF